MRQSVAPLLRASLFSLVGLAANTAYAQFPMTCPAQQPACFFTGRGCDVSGGPSFVWPGGCLCNGNSLFYRECAQGWGACTPPSGGNVDDYCGANCEYIYYYDRLCPDIEVPCLACLRREVAAGSSPSTGREVPGGPAYEGEPVSLTSGAMSFTHTDAAVGELVFSRTFDSGRVSDPSRHGSFGPGWNSSFEVRLVVVSPKLLAARAADGHPQYYFDDELDGTFVSELPYSTESTIETTASGYRRSFRAGGEEVYDASGNLVSVTDAAGMTTTYSRDGQGRLSTVTRLGRTMTVSYSGTASRPYQLIGPGATVLTTFGYDASNRLETVSYPDGTGYRYFYDAGSRIVRVEDAAGKPIEQHAYDGQGRAITSEIADGVGFLGFSYSATQTVVTDALGQSTTYTIANVRSIPRVTKVVGPCSSCGGSGGDTQEWTYDALGRTTSYKDGDGKVTTYTYDADGHLLTETNPLNQTTTYTYDSQGRLLTTTAADNGVTTLTQGPAGPLTITDAIDHTTTITYESHGKPATVTDPRDKTTTLTYNSTADLISVADPLGHATTFGYDVFGRRTTVPDALNNTTTTTYDARGRVVRVAAPDGTHSDFTHDASGRRTAVTDPMQRTTRYTYDAYGRLDSVLDPADDATRYQYDQRSNLIALTDAIGQVTRFAYDAYGRVKSVTYPGSGAETFTYDVVGRLKTRTDRKGVVTTFTYDAAGRLVGKSYSDGVTAPVAFTYDAVGRMRTAGNGTDTLTWTYDSAGNLLSEQSAKNSSSVAYTYDASGNRITVDLDGALFVTYGYDDASRLTTLTRGAASFTFGYDNANRRTSLSLPSGVVTSYAYDGLSRLTNLGAALGATTITSFAYTYDASGNRTTKTMPGLVESYDYDQVLRLAGVNRTGNVTDTSFYTYDGVGNRLSQQAGQSVRKSLYGVGNRLLSTSGGGPLRIRGHLDEPGTVTVNGQPARILQGNVFDATIDSTTGPNTVTVAATDLSGNAVSHSWTVNVPTTTSTYVYDPNGNLTSKTEGSDTWTYEWDAENKLKRVLKNNVEQARFAYDPQGRRVEKVAGGTTTTWTYEGQTILRESSGSGTLKYMHGPGTDEPLAQEDGTGALTFFHADALGSVTKITNLTGAVLTTRRYDSFGNFELAPASGYGFTGREWDPETSLFYYRARYYDPRIGRFLSEDPIGFAGGDNFYAYVDDSPTDQVDPFGLLGRRQWVPPRKRHRNAVVPSVPVPRPTPTPINCSGGPNATIGPRATPPPPGQCLPAPCKPKCTPYHHPDVAAACALLMATSPTNFAPPIPTNASIFVVNPLQCDADATFCDETGPPEIPLFQLGLPNSSSRPPGGPGGE